MKKIVVSSAFDNLNSQDVRFLEEAAGLGELHVALWPDSTIMEITGSAPKLPLAEREYFLQSIRHVRKIHLPESLTPDALPALDGVRPDIWVTDEKNLSPACEAFACANGIEYRVICNVECARYPTPTAQPLTGRKKVVVTGCYDWLHTGHVRFFEEVSEHGDLFVVVGHDENIRLLKGDGHPMFKADERRYMAGSLRYVTQALISSGSGWMDAEPEIGLIQPDTYAVNEDGDKPEKREFCQKHGLEYLVLSRTPKPGLAKRSSSELRGF